jgi:hypothetical protein
MDGVAIVRLVLSVDGIKSAGRKSSGDGEREFEGVEIFE